MARWRRRNRAGRAPRPTAGSARPVPSRSCRAGSRTTPREAGTPPVPPVPMPAAPGPRGPAPRTRRRTGCPDRRRSSRSRRAARRGTGWFASSEATSNSSARVSVRITPACSNSASTVTSEAATSAPVCDDVARAPAAERPLLTATIGFVRATRRAIRANLRGLPNDSRYSRITSVLVVGLPVLDQVVAGDVGLVADRDEGGQAEAERRSRSR